MDSSDWPIFVVHFVGHNWLADISSPHCEDSSDWLIFLGHIVKSSSDWPIFLVHFVGHIWLADISSSNWPRPFQHSLPQLPQECKNIFYSSTTSWILSFTGSYLNSQTSSCPHKYISCEDAVLKGGCNEKSMIFNHMRCCCYKLINGPWTDIFHFYDPPSKSCYSFKGQPHYIKQSVCDHIPYPSYLRKGHGHIFPAHDAIQKRGPQTAGARAIGHRVPKRWRAGNTGVAWRGETQTALCWH